MLDPRLATIVSSILGLLPLFIVGRCIFFALISSRRFVETTCFIEQHKQPKNEDGEPIQLRLTYRYQVAEQSYVGHRYYFGSINECDSKLLERYPEGSTHPLFFDPRCPSRSTLQTGIQPRIWFWVACAMVAACMIWIVCWIESMFILARFVQ